MKSRGGSYSMSVVLTAMRFHVGVRLACKQAEMT